MLRLKSGLLLVFICCKPKWFLVLERQALAQGEGGLDGSVL